MICQRCLQRFAARKALPPSTTRPFSRSTPHHTSTVTTSTTTTTTPRPPDRPAATSTPAAAQPFSTPLSPRPSEHEDAPESPANAAAEVKKRQRTPSSVPAGTVLKGLNFMKNKQDPVAMEDEAYPEWLWEVLRGKQEAEGAAEGEGDLFSKSKKQRRKAAKALRRQQMMGQDTEMRIPVYEQSVDLAGANGDAGPAKEAREELTSAMRKERRRKIKEDNFLRAMG